MDQACATLCASRSAVEQKEIRKRILRLLTRHGVNTNSKIAAIAPGWAHQIVSDSQHFGPALRKAAVSFYFARMCHALTQLTNEQKIALEKNIDPLRNESFAAMVAIGRNLCDSLRTQVAA